MFLINTSIKINDIKKIAHAYAHAHTHTHTRRQTNGGAVMHCGKGYGHLHKEEEAFFYIYIKVGDIHDYDEVLTLFFLACDTLGVEKRW